MKISPAVVTHILPEPFVVPPHVGVAAPGADACPILAVTANSSTVNDVEVPITSYATANLPYVPDEAASK